METVKNIYIWLQDKVAAHPALTIWFAVALILIAIFAL